MKELREFIRGQLITCHHGELSEELVAVWLVLVDGRRVLVLQVRSLLLPE